MRKIYSLVVKNYILQFLLISSLLLGNISVFGQYSFTNSNAVTISFDATVAGVNNGQFAAATTHIAATPLTGQLDADAWTRNKTPSSKGVSSGGVTDGGVYAFTVATGNRALGQQLASKSPNNSSVQYTLRVINNSGSSFNGYTISYKAYYRNDQTRSNSITFNHGSTNLVTNAVTAATVTSPQASSTPINWVATTRTVDISATVANGGSYYFRWSFNDVGGSGNRDELAIDDIVITPKTPSPPTVTTTIASSITATTATSGGNVTAGGSASVNPRGVVWGTSINPTLPSTNSTSNGTGTGPFSSSITGLTANTLYNYRAYATNSVGTSYGANLTFTTLPDVPRSLTTTGTPGTNDFTASWSAPLGGSAQTVRYEIEVYDNAGFNGTFVFTNTNVSGTSISVNSGLSPNTTYYYRVRSKTTGVSDWADFTSGVTTATSGTPTLSLTFSTLTGFSYTQGQGPSTEQSINISGANLSPTAGNITVDPTGTDYEISLDNVTYSTSSLTISYTGGSFIATPLYVRLPAGKSAGNYNLQNISISGGSATTQNLTVSGSVVILPPTVQTLNSVTNLTTTSVTLEAEITATNGVNASKRGVEYSTTNNFSNGSGTVIVSTGPYGTGIFTTNLTGLNPNTPYYYKGIAENSAGIGYGAQQSFTTLPNNPTVPGADLPTIHGFTATWTAPTGNGSANLDYEIEVHSNNTFTGLVGTYTQTTNTGKSLVINDAINIVSNTTYYYRIRSINPAGPNPAWVNFTTGIKTARPKPDINIQINSVNIANGGSHSYGVVPNSTNTNRTVVIQNTGTGTLNINSINLTNKNGNSFSITTTSLPTSVVAGGSTSIIVACNPSANGYYEATLTINSDDIAPEDVYTVELNAVSGTTTTLLSYPTGSQSVYGNSKLASDNTNGNVTAGGLTKGSGFTTSGTAGSGWGGNGLTNTNLTDAENSNDFVTFTVTPNCGYSLNLVQIPSYNVKRSGSGPASMQWQYRINSGAYQNIGGTVTASSDNSGGNTMAAINLTGISDLQNIPSGTVVTFRIVIWGGTHSGGNWYLLKTLSLTGVLSSTPDVTMTSPNQVAANNAVPNNTLNHIVSRFGMKLEDGLGTIDNISFTPTGTATSADDIKNFKLYTNITDDFTGATLRSTVSSLTVNSAVTFSGLNLTTNAAGTACSTDLYFFITADVKGSAQNGRTFTAGIPTVNFVNTAIIINNVTTGGTMEIIRISSTSVSVTSLPDFNSTGINEISNVQSFEVQGTGLTNDITIDAPTDFEVSLSASSGFGSSVTLAKNIDDEVLTTEVFVRFAPTGTTGQKSGDVEVKSSPLTDKLVSVDGLAVVSSPLEQPTNLVISDVTTNSLKLTWTNPSNPNTGDNTIVVIKEGSAVSGTPADGTVYTANTVYGSGDNIVNSGNNYIVFNSNSTNTVSITNLKQGTEYHVALFRSNGSSTEINYLESNPLIGNVTTRAGLQINHVDSLITVNFDETVAGVINGRLDGTGSTISTSNLATGKLESSAWAFLGSKTNAASFGVNQNANLNGNTSSQPTAGAGVYSTTLSSSPLNRALGIQSTAASNVGSITLKVQNNSGSTITNLRTAYKVYFINPTDTRQMRVELYYSADNVNYTKISNTEYSNPATNLSTFNYAIVNVDIPTNIIDGGFGYVRLAYDEPNTGIGNGNRPFIAIDDIKFVANPTTQDVEIDAVTGTLLDFKNLSKSRLVTNLTVSNDIIHNDIIELNGNTLTIANNYTRNNGTFSGTTGSLVIQGTGTLNDLPSLELDNLTLNKAAGATFVGDLTVNGALTLTSGNLNVGARTLTLNGSVSGSGSIVANNNSRLVVGGNGTSGIGTVRYSNTDKTLKTVIINRTGITGTNPAVMIANNLTITDSLDLTSGKIRLNNRNLILGSTIVTVGGNASSYIITDGSSLVTKEITGGNSYSFPLGFNPFLPLEITVPAGQPDADWSVSVTNGITETDGTTAETINGVLATWTVESSENVDRPVFTPTWTAAAEGANMTTYRSEARVIMRQGTSGQWNKQITTQAPGVVGSDPYSVSSWGYNDFPANTLFQVGVSHNSDLVINPLPVELISFDAVKFEGNGLLTWTTAWEVDNRGFYIERSENGNNWNSIGFVNGNGTKNDISNYSFIDRNLGELSNGVAYYRLQQVDFNGATEYSPVRVLRFNESEVSSVAKIQVMYQSFEKAPLVQFTTPNQGNVLVSLYTTQGKLVGAINQSVQSGVNQLVMPTPLSKGLYLLQINDGTQTFLEKVRF